MNTRCIYYPVRQLASDKDNMTLCPILDFANHDEKCSQLMPVLDPKVRAPGSRKSCGDYSFVSCADKSIERDQELFLRYGGHPNRTLFVEYGFVNRSAPEAFTSGEERGEIDVQDVIEQLFSESSLGLLIKETLENEGYWGYKPLMYTIAVHILTQVHFSCSQRLDATLLAPTCIPFISSYLSAATVPCYRALSI